MLRRAIGDHGREENLRKHGAQLAHAGAETVPRAADPGGENFRRRNKRGGVWAEVEEELREDVECEEVDSGEASPGEAEDAEDDGEDGEAADLEPFPTDAVDGEDGEAVAGEGAGAD